MMQGILYMYICTYICINTSIHAIRFTRWLPPTACSQKAHHSMVEVLAMACDLYSSKLIARRLVDSQNIHLSHINTLSQTSPTPPSGDGKKTLICQARQKDGILPTHRPKVNFMKNSKVPDPNLLVGPIKPV